MKRYLLSLIVGLMGAGFVMGDDASWRRITPDVIYGHKAGMALTYDVIQPSKDARGRAVLFMVSGGWVSPYNPPERIVREEVRSPNLFEKIVQSGFTLILVRHGSSPQFKVPEAVADVKLAIKHIRAHASDYAIDPERIGVCGGSAGGHLSLVLGTMGGDGAPSSPDPLEGAGSRVKAVVAYYPPTDIRAYVNHPDLSPRFPAIVFDEQLADDISPLLAVSPDDAATLLIHGDKDELVPIWHSEKLKAEMDAKKVECELVVVPGAAHGFNPEQTARAEEALIAWFDQRLK